MDGWMDGWMGVVNQQITYKTTNQITKQHIHVPINPVINWPYVAATAQAAAADVLVAQLSADKDSLTHLAACKRDAAGHVVSRLAATSTRTCLRAALLTWRLAAHQQVGRDYLHPAYQHAIPHHQQQQLFTHFQHTAWQCLLQ
jgi:hypothetical protein